MSEADLRLDNGVFRGHHIYRTNDRIPITPNGGKQAENNLPVRPREEMHRVLLDLLRLPPFRCGRTDWEPPA